MACVMWLRTPIESTQLQGKLKAGPTACVSVEGVVLGPLQPAAQSARWKRPQPKLRAQEMFLSSGYQSRTSSHASKHNSERQSTPHSTRDADLVDR